MSRPTRWHSWLTLRWPGQVVLTVALLMFWDTFGSLLAVPLALALWVALTLLVAALQGIRDALLLRRRDVSDWIYCRDVTHGAGELLPAGRVCHVGCTFLGGLKVRGLGSQMFVRCKF